MPKLQFLGLIALSSTLSISADLTLTMGGDVNFNKNLMVPHSAGYNGGGNTRPWKQLSSGIAGLINGDLNFANIETVVSDNAHLPAQSKAFVFRSHPNSIRHLIDIGFNLFSLANNHTYDFGRRGMQETLQNMSQIKSQSPEVQFAGIGRIEDVRRPVIFTKNGYRVAFAAIGIMDASFRAQADAVGMLHFYDSREWDVLLKNFRETDADLKILSVHHGKEGLTSLDSGQRAKMEQAQLSGDLDLIIGHHPHVVRPVQIKNGRLIFYSLGNYLMLGAADMSFRGAQGDYGLFSKVHFNYSREQKRLVAEQVDLLPLRNMHAVPSAFANAKDSGIRLQVLKQLGQSQIGAESLPFAISPRSHWGVWTKSQNLVATPR